LTLSGPLQEALKTPDDRILKPGGGFFDSTCWDISTKLSERLKQAQEHREKSSADQTLLCLSDDPREAEPLRKMYEAGYWGKCPVGRQISATALDGLEFFEWLE